MKFVINKLLLNNIISNTSSYVDKKDISSITSHILIEAKNSELNIKATDYEMGLKYKIKNVNIQVEGLATANATTMLNILKGLKDEDVIIETMNNFLFIRQNRSKFKLPMYNSLDFPEFPEIGEKKKFNINSNNFARALKKIFPTIDTNHPNYALNGAFIDIKDNYINLVGTDGKRMGLYKLESNNINLEENENFINIPKRAITEIQKLFFDETQIYYDESTLIAVSENFEFFAKLINKKFPDYERAIPKDFTHTLTLPREKILEGMKTISMICEKMKISIKPNSIIFESINEDNSEAKTEIELNTEVTNDLNLRVTNKYIFDFLNNIEDSVFKLEYNNEDSAFLISSDGLINVIMPTIL